MASVLTLYCVREKITDTIFDRLVSCDQRQRRPGRTGGFSLVEVVIAMGIVAFALIPLLGLVPVGLNTSRQAIDTTIEAQIIQQMTGQALQTDWTALTGLNSTTTLYYFDANGNTLPASSASSAIYTACFSVPLTPANPNGASLPGGTALPSGTTTYNMATVAIYILSTRTPSSGAITTPTLLISAATTSSSIQNSYIQKYTVFVPNNGR
jgi:uncharacterized protein (TIGR02598 family)